MVEASESNFKRRWINYWTMGKGKEMSLRDALDCVQEVMPKMNPILAEGVAYHQLNDVHRVIDNLMKIAFSRDVDSRLPEGFKYVGYEILKPEEAYAERARQSIKQVKNKPPRKKGLNMARTDTYLARYMFENDGRQFTRHVGLLFTRRGGWSFINGTKYGFSPVLKSRGISLTQRGYFVEFKSSKVHFEWLTHNYTVNGDSHHTYMPYSTSLHHSAKRSSKTFYPPLGAWLFAHYGMKETFDRFCGVKIEIVNSDDPSLHELDLDEYAVCRASLKVRGRNPSFAIVIRKEDMSPVIDILLGTILYVARIHPDRVIPENMDDPDFWKLMLGFSIVGANSGQMEQRIVSDIRNHFDNIEQMLDVDFKQELVAEDIMVEDIYEFIFYVIETMTHRSSGDVSSMASLWGKYITCVEYLTYDIRRGIFRARWDLINAASDATGRAVGGPVNTKKVTQIIARYLGPDTIERITSNHGEVSVFMTTTDNMVVGLSSHYIDQADTRKVAGGGKKSFDLNDPSKHLHESYPEVGSAVNLPKSAPIGYARFNMHTQVNDRLRIIRNENLREITTDLGMDISQKGM